MLLPLMGGESPLPEVPPETSSEPLAGTGSPVQPTSKEECEDGDRLTSVTSVPVGLVWGEPKRGPFAQKPTVPPSRGPRGLGSRHLGPHSVSFGLPGDAMEGVT